MKSDSCSWYVYSWLPEKTTHCLLNQFSGPLCNIISFTPSKISLHPHNLHMYSYVCITKTSDSMYYIEMYDVIHVPALNSSEWFFLVAVSADFAHHPSTGPLFRSCYHHDICYDSMKLDHKRKVSGTATFNLFLNQRQRLMKYSEVMTF
jgi:hypothetical protein